MAADIHVSISYKEKIGNESYKKLKPDQAATAIHGVILEVYKGPAPSREAVNAVLQARYGITLLPNGFNYKVETNKKGELEVRCTFKAPSPDGKGFLGTWVPE